MTVPSTGMHGVVSRDRMAERLGSAAVPAAAGRTAEIERGAFIMKRVFVGAAVAVAAIAAAGGAEAKGCIKGAIVGGVAGHYAGPSRPSGRRGGLRDRTPPGECPRPAGDQQQMGQQARPVSSR